MFARSVTVSFDGTGPDTAGPVHRTSPILVCWTTELHCAKPDGSLEKLWRPSRISAIFAPESD